MQCKKQWGCIGDTKVERSGTRADRLLNPLSLFLQPVITIRTVRDSPEAGLGRNPDQVGGNCRWVENLNTSSSVARFDIQGMRCAPVEPVCMGIGVKIYWCGCSCNGRSRQFISSPSWLFEINSNPCWGQTDFCRFRHF